MRATTRRPGRAAAYAVSALCLLALCLALPADARAQWTQPDAGNNISNTNTGNVGIGTNLPGFKLEVQGTSSRNTVGVTGDGDSVGYAGIKIGALTTANIPSNRAAAFVLSMRKDTWYGGDGSGPSFIIETSTKGFGFAAPFVITPTNDILLNSGRGAGGPAGAVPSYGNVGIGTATPGARLDIGAGAAARGAYTDLLVGAGGNNPQLEFYGATKSSAIAHDEPMGGLVFYTNGPAFTPSFFVGNGGSVGVGTTSPVRPFHVDVGALASNGMRVGRASAPNNPYFDFMLNTSGTPYGFISVGDNIAYRNLILSPFGGNVGVGNSNPIYKLDVAGGVNGSGLCIAGDCKTSWSQVGPWATSGSNVYFNTGSLGLGTSGPAFKLDSAGAIRGVGETDVTITNQYVFTGGGQQHYFDSSPPFAPLGRGASDVANGATTGTGANPGGIFVGGFGGQSAGAAGIYAQGGDTHTADYNRAWGGVGLFAQGGQNGPHTGGPYGWAYSRYAAAAFLNGYVQIGSNDGRASGLAIGFDGFNGYGAKLPPNGGMLVNGTVGVGTSTPAYKLDVQGGQINASGGLCIAGDCRVSWAQVSGGGGSTQWTTSGANILYNSGNVGIGVGTGTPAARLSVGGAGANVYNTDLWVENNIHVQGNEAMTQGGRGRLRVGTAWGYAGLYADVTSTGAANDLILGSGSGKVRVGPGGTTAMNFIVPNGNVGIGTPSPSSRLHVFAGAAQTALEVTVANGSYAAKLHGDNGAGGSFGLYVNAGTNAGDYAARVRNFAESADYMVVRGDGSVGVGTGAPGFKLDVQGGKVNASDGLCMAGVCKATWAEVGGGTTSPWTTSGSNISYSGGYVGIGTGNTPPAELLEVSGSGEVKVRAVGTISAGIQFRSTGASTWSEWQQFYGRLRLNTNDGTTTRPDVLTILPNGKVGIGKDTPTEALDVAGNIRATGSVSATYQDVAEWVPSTQKLSAGTVVVLDASKTNHVVASSAAYDTKVAGVVSAEPGVILGVGGEGKLKVATTGRVKVRVDASRGAVKVGDLLVTSGTEGVAMKSVPVELGGTQIHRPGTIIGKALEPLESGVGEILVLLSLQ